jgi:hypothetical protein
MTDQPEREQFGASALPLLPVVTDYIDEATFRSDRAKRIYGTIRWASAVAIEELRDGYDAAMRTVAEGPEPFMPTDEDWSMDTISASVATAINFIEGKNL